MVEALANLAHQVARDDRLRIAAAGIPAEPVGRDAGGEAHESLDRQRVAEAARGDEPGPGAVALDDGVRRLRRAMAEGDHPGEQFLAGHAALAGGILDGVEDADLELARRRQRLRRHQRPVLVQHDEIGEGAADIHAQKHGFLP
ncbi:MAG: hypothetical protein C0458_08610 [Methylobacterium sp.]|nr:hypothetical protein [Methylobacterium sp.]